MTIDDPYEEGAYAYGIGMSRTDNPYQPDTVDHEQWDDGWMDADEEESEG